MFTVFGSFRARVKSLAIEVVNTDLATVGSSAKNALRPTSKSIPAQRLAAEFARYHQILMIAVVLLAASLVGGCNGSPSRNMTIQTGGVNIVEPTVVIKVGEKSTVPTNKNKMDKGCEEGSLFVVDAKNGERPLAHIKLKRAKGTVTLANGKLRTVEVILISQGYKWGLGSFDTITNTVGSPKFTPVDLAASLFEGGELSSDPVVCVGMASHETEVGRGIGWEEERANLRAEALADAFGEHLRSNEIYILNLGMYKKVEDDVLDSAGERRVLLVRVEGGEHLSELEFNEAVLQGLDKITPLLAISPNSYSRWGKEKVKLMYSALRKYP